MSSSSSFFRTCCGEGEEESRFGSVVDPEEYSQTWDRRESKFVAGVRGKIRRVEDFVKSVGRSKSRSRSGGSRNFGGYYGDPCENKNHHRDSHETMAAFDEAEDTRRDIRCQPLDITSSFVIPEFPKTHEEAAFLDRAIASGGDTNFLLSELSGEERRDFVNAMEKVIVASGQVVIREGDVGDYFYVLQRGTVGFFSNKGGKRDGSGGMGVEVGRCEPGGSFGELALLYDAPRAVSCVVLGGGGYDDGATLWRIDQFTFRRILARSSEDRHNSVKAWLRGVESFKGLDDGCLARFAEALVTVRWKAGDRIVQKGEEGNVFYIVQRGAVRVHDIGLGDSVTRDVELGPGRFFGEGSLLTGEPRAANVTAVSDTVTTLALDRESFELCLGPLQQLLEFGAKRKFLTSTPLFACGSLTEPELHQLARLMNSVCYKKGELLAEPGKPYRMQVWFIAAGRVLAYSTKNPSLIHNLEVGDCFGDKSIRGDPSHVGSYTAVCEENVTAFVLTREEIESVIGDIERLGTVPDFGKARAPNPVHLSDLKKHRVLGSGAFGRVWLVTQEGSDDEGNSGSPTPFALKSISKRRVIDSKQVDSVKREKELLNLLDNQFILGLIASYQDERYLYLLLPVIPGGELFQQLQDRKTRTGGLPKRDAAFYAACVIEGLGHFHQRSIAYRDLKLENVLINADGYLVIVDLGFAKIVADKTYTLVGTPEYLAPEVIMNKGHDKAVDYWSFGVLVYELLVGSSPFYKRGTTQMDMFKRAVMVKYKFPDCVDDVAASFIEKLLVRRPSNRLGNLANGYLDVKNHTWFSSQGIGFKQIVRKEIEPPWIPDASKNLFTPPGREDFVEENYGPRLTKEEQDLFLDF